VAEQLALDEFMSGAVDCDERLARARRDPVNESRRYLLADAALTGNQQRAVDIGAPHALRALGEREKGTARLKQAVGAYDLALSNFASPGLEHSQTCRADRDRAVAALKQRLGPDWDRQAAE
jgi:hypothetical protein